MNAPQIGQEGTISQGSDRTRSLGMVTLTSQFEGDSQYAIGLTN
jgi:hypothetical protein